VSCAAALAVISTIQEHGLLENSQRLGEHFTHRLADLKHPLLAGTRGTGLWQAIVLAGEHAGEFEKQARAQGFLVNAVKPNAVRIAPPLIITQQQVDSFIDAIPAILDSIGE
ncbi:MAG: acetylornithine aminotransferase, partial [Actinomycetota bacterium]